MKIPGRTPIALTRMIALAVAVSMAPGCSWVHDRTTVDPNGARRFGSLLRRKPVAPPVVNLGVEPLPDSTKAAPVIEPTLPPLEGAVP